MQEERLAAEELKVWVLNQAGAQLLVGEIERVLEDRESRDQPGWERWHAGIVAVDLATPDLNRLPRHHLRQPHQFVVHVDDLVEPRPEQVLVSRLSPLSWLHAIPSG